MPRNAVTFDGWTLHPDSGELARAGSITRLAQQPLRVLIELLDHPGEVVKRERLVEILWPKGVVDFDASLNAAVRKLRSALGDDSETPRYIETLPRIGYRFIGRIDDPAPLVESQAVQQKSSRLFLLASMGFVVLATGWWMWSRSPAIPPATPEEVPRRTTNEARL